MSVYDRKHFLHTFRAEKILPIYFPKSEKRKQHQFDCRNELPGRTWPRDFQQPVVPIRLKIMKCIYLKSFGVIVMCNKCESIKVKKHYIIEY